MYIPVHYQHPESRTFCQYQAAELYFISHNRNNQSPLQAVFLPRISRRYGNIIEYTEPIGSTAHTVMSWRPEWELERCFLKNDYIHIYFPWLYFGSAELKWSPSVENKLSDLSILIPNYFFNNSLFL